MAESTGALLPANTVSSLQPETTIPLVTERPVLPRRMIPLPPRPLPKLSGQIPPPTPTPETRAPPTSEREVPPIPEMRAPSTSERKAPPTRERKVPATPERKASAKKTSGTPERKAPAKKAPSTPEKKAVRPKWGLSDADVANVVQLLAQQPVFGVIAPTGSGKSTTLIEEITKVVTSCVFVVEPTVVAADSLRRRMQEFLGKSNVGMAAEGFVQYVNPKLTALREQRAPPKNTHHTTKLVYCTSGHMKRAFLDIVKYGLSVGLDKADLAFCDVLVLDEAHIGSLDLEEIMNLWKLAFEAGASVPILMLASASLTMASTPFPKAKSYEVVIPGHKVSIDYADKDYKVDSKELYTDTAKRVLAYHAAQPVGFNETSVWLVFGPGMAEIEQIAAILLEAGGSSANATETPTSTSERPLKLLINVVHGSNTVEETAKIFQPIPKGWRRVVVATNVAELSITIDDLSGVFDTMTEKVGETSMSGGFRLALYPISKASARQRAGRTGRTRAGFVLRMCTEKFFDNLPEQRANEIARVPLHSLVIETMDIGLNPLAVYKGSLSPQRLQDSVNLLRTLGMIVTSPSGTTVTESGRFAPRFPLSVRASAVLWRWLQTGKQLFPCISVVCLIDCFGPSYFFYPRRQTPPPSPDYDYEQIVQEQYKTYFEQYDSPSDLETLLKMWLKAIQHFKKLNPPSWQLAAYNRENMLNNKKMTELFNIARQVERTLTAMGHKVQLGTFKIETVLNVLSPILRTVYADSIFTREGRVRGGVAFVDRNRNVYRLDRRFPLTSSPTTAKQIVALLTSEIQRQYGAQPTRYITLSQPLTSSQSVSEPSRESVISEPRPTSATRPNPQLPPPRPRVPPLAGLPTVTASLPPTGGSLPGLKGISGLPQLKPPTPEPVGLEGVSELPALEAVPPAMAKPPVPTPPRTAPRPKAPPRRQTLPPSMITPTAQAPFQLVQGTPTIQEVAVPEETKSSLPQLTLQTPPKLHVEELPILPNIDEQGLAIAAANQLPANLELPAIPEDEE